MPTISLGQIVIDSGNAGELATFYSRLLDRPWSTTPTSSSPSSPQPLTAVVRL